MRTIAWPVLVRPSLEWKTRPTFCPVSLSLSTAKVIPPFYSKMDDWIRLLLKDTPERLSASRTDGKDRPTTPESG
jgi:hypothetical protein